VASDASNTASIEEMEAALLLAGRGCTDVAVVEIRFRVALVVVVVAALLLERGRVVAAAGARWLDGSGEGEEEGDRGEEAGDREGDVRDRDGESAGRR
jgi:hypothetical protein